MDASVARTAGSNPSPEVRAGLCRAVLEAIREAHHISVFSQEGFAEWRRHERSFARRWLTRMFAGRRVEILEHVGDKRFRANLLECAPSKTKRQAMEKDAHLLEAALRADRIVISCDEKVRALFQDACSEVHEIRTVHWANPEIEAEEVVPWLQAGARAEAKRRLSAR